MTTNGEAPVKLPRPPPSPEIASTGDIEPIPELVLLSTSAAPSVDNDAPRKQKRRSGSSVDLTYRYHEPSEEELSWTEDEQGNRRRRKSRKRKSGGGDDFKTGIM